MVHMAKHVKPEVRGQRVKDPTTGLWLKKDPGPDEAVLVIQVAYTIPKEERDNYEFPKFTAADCLRQDLQRWEEGHIPLAELIWNDLATIRSVTVTR